MFYKTMKRLFRYSIYILLTPKVNTSVQPGVSVARVSVCFLIHCLHEDVSLTKCPINKVWWHAEPMRSISAEEEVLCWVCIVMARCLSVSPCTWAWPDPPRPARLLLAWLELATDGPGCLSSVARPGRGFARQWMILYSWMDLAAVSCTEQPRGTSRERQGRDTGRSVSFELSFKHPQPRLGRVWGDQQRGG